MLPPRFALRLLPPESRRILRQRRDCAEKVPGLGPGAHPCKRRNPPEPGPIQDRERIRRRSRPDARVGAESRRSVRPIHVESFLNYAPVAAMSKGLSTGKTKS